MGLRATSATKVGAMIITCVVLAGFSLSWLGVISPLGKSHDEFNLSFHFASVRGLNKGAKVKINGNDIGYVENIDLSMLGGVDVLVRINDKKHKVYENAEVVITKESILGGSYIEITQPVGGFYEKKAETSGQFYMQILSGIIKPGDYLNFVQGGQQRVVAQVVDVNTVSSGIDRLLIDQIDKNIILDNSYAYIASERKIWDPDEKKYQFFSYIDIFAPLEENSYFKGSREAGPEDLIAHLDRVVDQTSSQIGHLNEELIEILQKVQELLDDVKGFIATDEIEELFNTAKTQITTIGGNIESVTNELNKLVMGNSERIDIIMSNILDTSESIKEISQDPMIRESIEELSSNLKEMTARLNSILEDIEELTKDPELKEDIKGSVRSARKTLETASVTIDDISKRLDDVSQIRVSGELKARFAPKSDRYFSDLNFKLKYADSDEFLYLGLDEIGEINRFNFQLGSTIFDNLDARFGVRRSKVGIGADYHFDKFFIRSDIYDPNDIVFNAYMGYKVSDNVYIMIGGEELFDRDLFNLGVLLDF